MSILDQPFQPGRFAVIDLETTGFSPAVDRVLEVAVYHLDWPTPPRRVVNTLINPLRKVAGTEIHGLTDADVRDAPTFAEAAPHIAEALSGRVVAAHNVYFDLRFLKAELERCGLSIDTPHLCTMYLAPLLGLGERRPLEAACAEHGLPVPETHAADADARAAADLLGHFLSRSGELGVETFRDLASRKKYKFTDSFSGAPPRFKASQPSLRQVPRQLSRTPSAPDSVRRASALRQYFEALLAAVVDFELSPDELSSLRALAEAAALSPEQLRAAHGKVYAAFLNRYLDDFTIDDTERWVLSQLWDMLSRLGWAPGQ